MAKYFKKILHFPLRDLQNTSLAYSIPGILRFTELCRYHFFFFFFLTIVKVPPKGSRITFLTSLTRWFLPKSLVFFLLERFEPSLLEMLVVFLYDFMFTLVKEYAWNDCGIVYCHIPYNPLLESFLWHSRALCGLLCCVTSFPP